MRAQQHAQINRHAVKLGSQYTERARRSRMDTCTGGGDQPTAAAEGARVRKASEEAKRHTHAQ